MISEFLESDNIFNLVDLLRRRAEARPDKVAYIFLVEGENEEVKLTYGELDKQARAIASELQNKFAPGERALLIYPPGLEFISAFFGCLYAGVIAVPCYPPDPNKLKISMAKLEDIIVDCSPEVILSTKEFLDLAAFIFPDYPDLEKMDWIASDKVDGDLSNSWREPEIDESTLAFLQYTSGSTGDPNGVMINHGNVLYNEEMYKTATGHTDKAIFVGWIPLYHDMGLIGNVLHSMYMGVLCVLMSPISFLQKPVLWLKAISKYKATISCAPNFAFDLCSDRVTKEQMLGLDLSSWEIALNGAEPVKDSTLKRFYEKFKNYGFRHENFHVCLGMAEATLFVSGGLKEAPTVVRNICKSALKKNKVVFCSEADSCDNDFLTIIGCGGTWMEQKIIIANSETLTQCPNNQVGEIWISGPNISQGYWNKPELTKDIFQAYLSDTKEGPFLRTGDLGFIQDGELFVAGRLKDLIIIRGKNHYPQDVEATAEQSHGFLRRGCASALSVEVNNEERLVVVQEIKPKELNDLDTDKVIEAIRKAVLENHKLQIYTVVLIKPRSISKTSSGKIQRRKCKKLFLEDKLDVVAKDILPINNAENIMNEQSMLLEKILSIPQESARLVLMDTYLQGKISEILRIPFSKVNMNKSLIQLGVDSFSLAGLMEEIKTGLGIEPEIEHMLEYSDLKTISEEINKALSI